MKSRRLLTISPVLHCLPLTLLASIFSRYLKQISYNLALEALFRDLTNAIGYAIVRGLILGYVLPLFLRV